MPNVPNSLRAMHEQHKNLLTKSNLFSVDLDLIEEEEGFNVGRNYEDPEVIEHIRRMADAYKQGRDMPPLKVKVVDGRVLVRGGHCRRRAALLAREEGAEISRLAVLETKGDELDQNFEPLTSDEGLKLKPLGRARVYAKLIAMGVSENEIAQRAQKTPTHVQQYLALNNLPIKLKQYIDSGQLAWSNALQLFNQYGTAAVEMVERAEDPQKHNGRTPTVGNSEDQNPTNSGVGTVKPSAVKAKRITQKAIDAQTGYRSRIPSTLIRTVTDQLETVVRKLDEATDDGEHVVIRLSREDAAALRLLHQTMLPGEKQHQDGIPENAMNNDSRAEVAEVQMLGDESGMNVGQGVC